MVQRGSNVLVVIVSSSVTHKIIKFACLSRDYYPLSFYSLQHFRRYKRNVKPFSYPIIWRIRCNTTSKIYNQDRLKGLIESVALTTLDHNGSYLQELVISPCFFSRLASPIIACCLFVGVIANVPF